MRWTKAERDFVASARVARLATVDRKGVPSNVPVCPLFDGGKLHVGTAADAKKVRNILLNPYIALVFDDYSERWQRLRGIMVQGQARMIPGTDSRRFRQLRKKFYAKYPQYETSSPLGEDDSAIIAIDPLWKLSWGL